MAELDWITIHGFRSFSRLEKLELRPINVLVGANGSGKSNFIEIFVFLHAIREGQLFDYVARKGGADSLLHFGAKTTKRAHLHVSFENGTNQYDIALEPTESDELFPVLEHIYFWDRAKYDQPLSKPLPARGKEAGISNPGRGIAKYVRDHLASWRLYHFHDTGPTSPMKKTGDLEDNRFFRPDGSNLAAFLYYLKAKNEASYSLIRRTIRRVAPFFDDFILEPSRLHEGKIRLQWRHRGSDAYFDASSFSDGSLRFVALATLFLQPEELRPSVILVDEPELGLHPYAITLLASLIKQAATKSQVIVSTQSPLLLDHFAPEDVLVADRVEGRTELTRPDPDALAAWFEDYSLGQLWEKNELGGRPGRE